MAIPIAIVIILVFAAVTVVVLARRAGSNTGGLSRETRRRDAASESSAPATSTSTELEATGRERSDETQGATGGAVTRRRRGEVVEYEPVDEEEIGVTRRQFLNRGLLTAVGFGLAGFAPAMLAFLWPLKNAPGFGGQITLNDNLDTIKKQITTNKLPYYAPSARTYIELYPSDPSALDKAKKVYKPAIYKNLSELGVIALYQRCVHLGCRVPFCPSSQWFECPCHGSKYSRVGQKTAGPAPRGLDSFYLTNNGGQITVDTGVIYIGPPIGTNTTGQNAEGPLCV